MSDAALDRRLSDLADEHDPWTDMLRWRACHNERLRAKERAASLAADCDELTDRLSTLPAGQYWFRHLGDTHLVTVDDDGVDVTTPRDLLGVRYADQAPSPDDIRRHGYAAILPAEAVADVRGGAA